MNKLIQIFKIKDLRKKIVIIVFLLLVFRVLAAIPIPGIDALRLKEFLGNNQLFGFF